MNNQIKENIVTYGLAKILQEKGFSVPVRNYFLLKDKGTSIYEGFEHEYWGDYKIVDWNKKDIIGIKPFSGFISAPTYDLVIQWLLVNFNIDVHAEREYVRPLLNETEMKFFWYARIDCPKSKGKAYADSFGTFETKEQAIEAGILYTLNNLI